MNQYWSWVLAVVGLAGMWLVGRRNKSGWLVCIGLQLLWGTYAVVSRQWGFLLSAAAYLGVNSWNWWKWHREDRANREVKADV